MLLTVNVSSKMTDWKVSRWIVLVVCIVFILTINCSKLSYDTAEHLFCQSFWRVIALPWSGFNPLFHLNSSYITSRINMYKIKKKLSLLLVLPSCVISFSYFVWLFSFGAGHLDGIFQCTGLNLFCQSRVDVVNWRMNLSFSNKVDLVSKVLVVCSLLLNG